jgi:YesN/AraC family two-component response regulator
VLLFYAFLSYRLVKKVDKKDFDLYFWVKTISIAFAGIAVGYVIYYALYYANVLTSTQDYIIAFMEIVFISFVGYMAFMQPDIFNGKPIGKVIPFLEKYHKSGLSEEYSTMLKSRLINLINDEKIHLRSNVGLIDIAIAINVSRNHASQVINEQFNVSFYDFINKYRIVEAKKIITNNDDSNLNLTEIAYTVGFNNRISFYNAFKKFTGLSPSQYLKTKIAS